MKNRALLISVVGFSLLILGGCLSSEKSGKKDGAAEVSSQTAPDNKLKVINVLEKKFYDDAHIAGSINVDYADLEKEAAGWDKDATIVVYCSNYACTASSGAARILTGLGFNDVRAYEGGMAEWYQLSKQDAAYAVEGPSKEDYLAMMVKKPSGAAEGVKVITAEELKELLTKK